MKKCALILCLAFFCSSAALAATVKYQVTGPVLEIRDDVIVVQKDNDKWELARDKTTVVAGDLKVGSKVTVFYTMQATKIEVKEAAKKK